MTNTARQFKKPPTRQLGCRATEAETKLLNAAAVLDKRDRNTFIVLAAVERAKAVLQAHGIDESSIVPTKRKKRAA